MQNMKACTFYVHLILVIKYQCFNGLTLDYYLLNCTFFSNEDNHCNPLKSTSRKEHKAEKIIQKPLSPLFLIMYQHTIIKQLVTNEVLYERSSINTSVPLHRKGQLTLLNKKQPWKTNSLVSAKSSWYECILKPWLRSYMASNYRGL